MIAACYEKSGSGVYDCPNPGSNGSSSVIDDRKVCPIDSRYHLKRNKDDLSFVDSHGIPSMELYPEKVGKVIDTLKQGTPIEYIVYQTYWWYIPQ